jgi:hypothetical protein
MIGFCPQEMKSSEETASAPWDLSEMLEALEAGIFQLRHERDRLREELEELRRQSAIQQSSGARRGRNARKGNARQKHLKKNDPVQTPTVKSVFPNEPVTPRKIRNALGRTLTQLRANRDCGHSQ